MGAAFKNQDLKNNCLTCSEEFSLYVDIVESFFLRNFPLLERDKFWTWFLKMLTGKLYDINNLEDKDAGEILMRLKEWEGLLFDTKKAVI